MTHLLATITVDGTAFRGSLRGFAGQNFYQPFVKRMPSLELGQVEDSGKIGVKFGNLTLTNDYLNASHPFALERYEELLTAPQLYATTLKWGEAGDDLFNGSIFLQSVTDNEISFALTDTEFSKGARPFTLTDNFAFVEAVTSSGTAVPVSIQALNHGFVTGTVVIFEKMTNYGQNLQYSGVAADNFYYVVRTGTNTFTLQDQNFIPVTSGYGSTGTFTSDGDTHRVGVPLRVPFSWGIVTNVTPVISKKSDEVANPDLQTNNSSYPIEIREDGVLIYSTDSSSSEYWNASGGSGVAPTSTVIKLNSNTTGGVLSISGISSRGSTLSSFYTHVASELSLSLDTSLA
jgi:hypothetical protein